MSTVFAACGNVPAGLGGGVTLAVCSVPGCDAAHHRRVGQCKTGRQARRSPSQWLRRDPAWPEIRARILERDAHRCACAVADTVDRLGDGAGLAA